MAIDARHQGLDLGARAPVPRLRLRRRARVELADLPGLLRDTATAWLAGARRRATSPSGPRRDVWSPLEYACHVRDVHLLFAERLRLMLDEDEPAFANWDQDATAVERDYAGQDPADGRRRR